MIRLTQEAADVLAEALDESGVGPDKGLRLKPGSDGFTLDVDAPGRNDRVIDHTRPTLLIVDRDLEHSLDDMLIDLDEGPEGLDLVIRPASEL